MQEQRKTTSKAQNKEEAIVLSMDKLQIMHEKKRNCTSKEEEPHATTLGRNRRRGKEVVNFSNIYGSLFAKIIS
jgi:hypothetical protein